MASKEETIYELLGIKQKPNKQDISIANQLIEQEVQKKFMEHTLKIRNLAKIELNDAYSVNERTNLYFQMCLEDEMKPTLSGLACALGTSTSQLYRIKNDLSHVDTKEAQIIKDAYQVLEMLWEDYMLNGKINPVTGIFISKNQFGYVDSKEVIVKPVVDEKELDPEEIRKRYLEENCIEGEVVAESK